MAADRSVFISYAWGVDDPLIDRLYDSLLHRGFDVRRDRRDMKYKDSISRYIDELADGQAVVVVLSKRYIESPYCMAELLKIHRNHRNHQERIFPFVLPSAWTIFDDETRLDHVGYWERKTKALRKKVRKYVENVAPETHAQLRWMNRFKSEVDPMLAGIADKNVYDRVKLEENNFAIIASAIEEWLGPEGGSSRTDEDADDEEMGPADLERLLRARQAKLKWGNQEAAGVAMDPIHVVSWREKASQGAPRISVGTLKSAKSQFVAARQGLHVYRVSGHTGAHGTFLGMVADVPPDSSSVGWCLDAAEALQRVEIRATDGAARVEASTSVRLPAGAPVVCKDGRVVGLVTKPEEPGQWGCALVGGPLRQPDLLDKVEGSELESLRAAFGRCLNRGKNLEAHLRAELGVTGDERELFDALWAERDLEHSLDTLRQVRVKIDDEATEAARVDLEALLELVGWIVPRAFDWAAIDELIHGIADVGPVKVSYAGNRTMAEMLVARVEGRPCVLTGDPKNLRGKSLLPFGPENMPEPGALVDLLRGDDEGSATPIGLHPGVRSLIKDLAIHLQLEGLGVVEGVDFETLCKDANDVLRTVKRNFHKDLQNGRRVRRSPPYIIVLCSGESESRQAWDDVAKAFKRALPELTVLRGQADAKSLLGAGRELNLKEIVVQKTEAPS